MARVTRIDPTTRSEVEKKKVCAYCRVSRSTADQLNSYARQIRVYTDLIKRNPGWQLVEIFADEGITGTSAAKRPEFQRMLKMCEQKQIDLIITIRSKHDGGIGDCQAFEDSRHSGTVRKGRHLHIIAWRRDASQHIHCHITEL